MASEVDNTVHRGGGQWSLSQVLVWIATRDDALARECANTDIGECNERIIMRNMQTGMLDEPDASDAWKKHLVPAVDQKRIAGTANRSSVDGEQRKISPVRFPPNDANFSASSHYLDHYDGVGGVALRPISTNASRSWSTWTNVKFKVDDVLRLWRPRADGTAKVPVNSSSSAGTSPSGPIVRRGKVGLLVDFLKQRYPNGTGLTSAQLIDDIKIEAKEIGTVSPRTLSTALCIAFPERKKAP